MGVIDIIILIVLVIFFVWGLKRGLIRQVLEIIGIIAAFIGAFYLAHHVAGYLDTKLDLPYQVTLVISAIAIFIGILIVFYFLGLFFQKVTSVTLLGPLDRIGGGLFGVFKGALLISLVLIILLHLPLPADFKDDVRDDPLPSVIYPILPGLFDLVLSHSPARLDFKRIMRTSEEVKLEKIREKAKNMEKKIKEQEEKIRDSAQET
ncbi:MAG: CvpA family protein [bacterium]|nr:MAG: CvpA family protein [bacterium]